MKQKIKTKREKSTTTVGHYVRNADLLPAVIEAKGKGEVTDTLITMIRLIAVNYSKKWRFANYSYREDMVSTAVENLCRNALKFDTVKYSNPFSYYTSAIHNSFLQYMAEEKKHRILRDKLMIDAGAKPSFGFNESSEDSERSSYDSDEFFSAPRDYSSGANDQPEIPEDAEGEDASEDGEADARYDRVGHRARAPGPVVVLKADDVYLDPISGVYVKKAVEGR